jgi:uncharacterized protein YndB with AHSA1/START domain
VTPSAETEAMGTVEVERRIAARPETVFSYLIDPERFARWQGVEAEIDPQPGGVFRFRTTTHPHYVATGHYVEVQAPSRIVFTWGWEPNPDLNEGQHGLPPGASTVEVVLVPDGEGTLLRLRHTGLPTKAACRFHGMGWESTLNLVLADLAEGIGGAQAGRP